MATKIYCGCGDYADYGTITVHEGAYQLHGEVKTLRSMLLIAEGRAGQGATHETVLDTMCTVFTNTLWARKYNQNHDARGRFDFSEDSSITTALAASGDFSYNPVTKSMPHDGLMLSIHPEASAILDAKTVTGKQIHDYMGQHKALLADKTNYVGAWLDTVSKKLFLDISTRLGPTEHLKAVALSQQYGQRAYYDVGRGEEVRVMDEAHAHQAASDTTRRERKARKKIVLLGLVRPDTAPRDLDALAKAIRDAANASQ